MTTGFTWPITASDNRPVHSFKTGLANFLRRMAEDEIRNRRPSVGPHELSRSFAREDTLLEVADLCENIVIEGEG